MMARVPCASIESEWASTSCRVERKPVSSPARELLIFMEIRAIERDGKIVIQTKELCVKTNQLYSIFPPGTYEHHSGYLCFPGPVPFEPEKLTYVERDWVDA